MDGTLDISKAQKSITLKQVCEIIEGRVICCEERLNQQVCTASGCDLMSDVLAFSRPGSVLLTGLTNSQVVRTAEMLDLKAVVFVRNKRPDQATVALAESMGLVLMLSPYPLYESCGRLYATGLSGCQNGAHAVEDVF